MRRIFLILLATLSTSCSISDFESEGWIATLRNYWIYGGAGSFEFDSAASSHYFYVLADNTPWQIFCDADWVSVEPSFGTDSTDVVVSVTDNMSLDSSRVAALILTSAVDDYNYNKTFQVVQNAAKPTLKLSATDVRLSNTILSSVITVTSNCKWSVDCDCDWLTVTSDVADGKIHLSAISNDMGYSRVAQLFVSYGKSNQTIIKVLQL